MKVEFSKDIETVERIKEALKENGGYCPCMIEKSDDTKCMCKDFRDKIKDETFEGLCHCGLYYKYK